MTSILTSFSLFSLNHPKYHAYCEKRVEGINVQDAENTYDVGISVKLSALDQTRVVRVG